MCMWGASMMWCKHAHSSCWLPFKVCVLVCENLRERKGWGEVYVTVITSVFLAVFIQYPSVRMSGSLCVIMSVEEWEAKWINVEEEGSGGLPTMHWCVTKPNEIVCPPGLPLWQQTHRAGWERGLRKQRPTHGEANKHFQVMTSMSVHVQVCLLPEVKAFSVGQNREGGAQRSLRTDQDDPERRTR